MAGLTIKYGDTVLSEDGGTVNKTLKTAGKYCEKDFTVSMVEEASVVSFKKFTITIAEKQSGKWFKLVDADADIAAHINDSTFGVAWHRMSETTAAASTASGFYTNAPMAWNASDGSVDIYGMYTRTANTGVGAPVKVTNPITTKTSAAGNLFVNTDGSIQQYASSTYPLLAGTYQLVVYW